MFFGVAPIFHGSAQIFGVFSYCGCIDVTFVSCRRIVSDPAFLAECLQATHDELLGALKSTAPKPAARRRPKPNPRLQATSVRD